MKTVGQIETHTFLPIGLQIDPAWIGFDDPTDLVEEPPSESVALGPRYDSENRQIPMSLRGVNYTQ